MTYYRSLGPEVRLNFTMKIKYHNLVKGEAVDIYQGDGPLSLECTE